MTNSANDLAHAYMNVFERFSGEGGYVLVLEDDVIFDDAPEELKLHLGRVNAFLGAFGGRCAVYTLGSIASWMVPFKGGGLHHRRILGSWHATHAVIWSREARARLMRRIGRLFDSPSDDIVHIDQQPENWIDAYTYYRAIATQIFPQTENSENWCSVCKNVSLPQARKANRRFRRALTATHRALKLDSQPRPGWDIMYGLSFGVGGGLLLLVVVAACGAAALFFAVTATRSALRAAASGQTKSHP